MIFHGNSETQWRGSFLPDRAFLRFLLGNSSATSRDPEEKWGLERHLEVMEGKTIATEQDKGFEV